MLGCAILRHVLVCYMLCNHVMLPIFNSYVLPRVYTLGYTRPVSYIITNNVFNTEFNVIYIDMYMYMYIYIYVYVYLYIRSPRGLRHHGLTVNVLSAVAYSSS